MLHFPVVHQKVTKILNNAHHREAFFGSVYVSRKLPTYPSPKPTLTLSSHLGQNDGLGEVGGQFPKNLNSSPFFINSKHFKGV